MKKLLLIIAAGVILSACETTGSTRIAKMSAGASSISSTLEKSGSNIKHPDAYTVSTEIVRAGTQSYGITLSHEMGCYGFDCGNVADKKVGDQQRYELMTTPFKPNSKHWVGFSVYLDANWQSLNYVKTTIWQVKTFSVEQPHWQIATYGDTFILLLPNYIKDNRCVISQTDFMKGRWTDIQIYTDYSQQDNKDDNYEFLSVTVNGEKVCSRTKPFVIPSLESKWTNRCGTNCQQRLKTYRFGQYRWPVSEWFMANTDKDIDFESGDGNPFAIDWGVELPTNTIYFDEIRIGKTLESVQINQNKPVD
jgi:hypothetical protein